MSSSTDMLKAPSRIGKSYYLTTIFSLMLFSIFIVVPSYMFGSTPEANIFIMLILAIFLAITCALMKRFVFAFFNSIAFFLFVYPFYIQSIFRFRFTGGGDVDLSQQALVLFGGFLVIVNCIGLLGLNKEATLFEPSQRINRYVARMGGIKAFLIGVATIILILLFFGYVEIFLPRQKDILYGIQPLNNYERFFIGILRMIPFWAVYFYIISSHRGSLWKIIVGAMPILFIALLVSNPYNTQRFLSLSGLLLIFFALVRKGWLRSLWENSYAFVALGLLLLPATSMMRSGRIEFNINELLGMLFSLEFSAFTMFNDLFLIQYSSDIGPVRLISAILIFVPRVLWPAKNPGTGESVAQAAGYEWYNVGIPPIADAYLDFGFAGVILLAVGVGFALRYAASAFSPSAARDNGLVAGAKISLIALVPILMRGDFSTFFIAFYSTIIAFAVVRFFNRLTILPIAASGDLGGRSTRP